MNGRATLVHVRVRPRVMETRLKLKIQHMHFNLLARRRGLGSATPLLQLEVSLGKATPNSHGRNSHTVGTTKCQYKDQKKEFDPRLTLCASSDPGEGAMLDQSR